MIVNFLRKRKVKPDFVKYLGWVADPARLKKQVQRLLKCGQPFVLCKVLLDKEIGVKCKVTYWFQKGFSA